MTDPARVLIVDDSVVIRRLVSEALGAEPQVEVVGTAANGRLGLEKIERLKPEIVVLDVEMPELTGLETLEAIRKMQLSKRPKVIMFSTLCERGAATTVKALALGASDYVTKPANVGGVSEGQQQVRERMVPKIIALVPRLRPKVSVRPASASARASRPKNRFHTARIDVLVIGSSTGGPNALAEVIPRLSAQLPVPALIVQHMPPMFTRFLAERLDHLSPFPVGEATHGQVLEAGCVYIAPGGIHMSITKALGRPDAHQIKLHDGPAENSCKPAVDVLFRSAAAAFGEHTLGLVLTGMGKDGLVGCEHIQEAGGQVVSQDEETSVVWGMPGAVAKADVTDRILPLDGIAAEIERRVWRRRRRPLRSAPVTKKAIA